MVCSVEVLFLAEPVRSHTHDKMITIQDGTKMRKPITAGTYYERCRRKKRKKRFALRQWNYTLTHTHTKEPKQRTNGTTRKNSRTTPTQKWTQRWSNSMIELIITMMVTTTIFTITSSLSRRRHHFGSIFYFVIAVVVRIVLFFDFGVHECFSDDRIYRQFVEL